MLVLDFATYVTSINKKGNWFSVTSCDMEHLIFQIGHYLLKADFSMMLSTHIQDYIN